MKLTKGKISKLYSKKKQTLKKELLIKGSHLEETKRLI